MAGGFRLTDLRQDAERRLDRSGQSFLLLISEMAEPLWNRPGPGGGWSIAQVAEHVTLVEIGTAKLFRKRMFQAPADPELLRQTAGKDGFLRDFQADRQTRRTAPDFVTPNGSWTERDPLIEAFREARASVVSTLRAGPADLRSYAWPHPILGPLDAYQWALFLVLHLERHLLQIENLVQAASHTS